MCTESITFSCDILISCLWQIPCVCCDLFDMNLMPPAMKDCGFLSLSLARTSVLSTSISHILNHWLNSNCCKSHLTRVLFQLNLFLCNLFSTASNSKLSLSLSAFLSVFWKPCLQNFYVFCVTNPMFMENKTKSKTKINKHSLTNEMKINGMNCTVQSAFFPCGSHSNAYL